MFVSFGGCLENEFFPPNRNKHNRGTGIIVDKAFKGYVRSLPHISTMTSTVRTSSYVGRDYKDRTSITILVLGDEGTGKSSLISTFVSRHFSEIVPGIMTRVRLPPDPENSCITTIVDSQGGDAALMSAVATMSMPGGGSPVALASSLSSLQQSLSSSTTGTGNLGGIENVDCIVLTYDLDREETFFRLENHWLPLIARCYSGDLPVIVAGNKMDLFRPSDTDDQILARSRQQIVSLMQRFRFIRQCIKCSAKNLLHVDEVFLKAQQAVLYPFEPLYDLDVGKLSQDCRRAFTRIFRMHDRDNDGLLSHSELDRFQHETFHVPVYERDLSGWKKVVSRNNPDEEVVRDGKFTVAGFLAIFDVFISQNRLDVPWQALRKFGYDDRLVLQIPDSISSGPEESLESPWKLSHHARRFLSDLFHQFDSDEDGVLSLEDIDAIFSILPNPSLPPWHPIRSPELFRESFSLPRMPSSPMQSPESSGSGGHVPVSMSQSLSASGITIVSGETFPSVDISSVSRGLDTNVVSKPLSFLDWMGMWHAVATISPGLACTELFRLGHVEDLKKSNRRRGKKRSAAHSSKSENYAADALLPSREVHVLFLGSPGSGKSALLNALRREKDPLMTSRTRSPETSSTHVCLERKKKQKSNKGDEDERFVVHLTITEVPEAEAENQAKRKKELSKILSGGNCDLVALAFDSTNSASLAYAKHLEDTLLTEDMPRVYVGTKSDQCGPTRDRDEEDDDDSQPATVIDEAAMHCRGLDLEPPLVTSAGESMLNADGELGDRNRASVLSHLARCCLCEIGVERLRAKPHEEQKRREAARRRNRKMMWLGVGVGVVAVAVVGYLWTGATNGGKTDNRSSSGGRLGWFRSFFSRHISGGTGSRAETS